MILKLLSVFVNFDFVDNIFDVSTIHWSSIFRNEEEPPTTTTTFLMY